MASGSAPLMGKRWWSISCRNWPRRSPQLTTTRHHRNFPQEALNRQRARLGLETLPVELSWWGQLWQRAGQVRIASLPELEGPGAALPSRFRYVGPILDPDPADLPAEVAELVRGEDAPVVVVSLSTTYMHQGRRSRPTSRRAPRCREQSAPRSSIRSPPARFRCRRGSLASGLARRTGPRRCRLCLGVRGPGGVAGLSPSPPTSVADQISVFEPLSLSSRVRS
jgi:hypothetical protein